MEKILLVLGASSDLGIAFLQAEIEKYEYVIAHYYHNGEELFRLKKKYPEKLCLMNADFNNMEEVCRFSKEIISGRIPNYVVHFPAMKCRLRRFEKITINDIEENMRISMKSITVILQNLLPLMSKKHYGKIVFILSVHTATDGYKYISDYMIAKYALLGLMKSLSMEYKDKGIRINGVSPDTIETKFISELPEIAIEKKKNENNSKRLLTVSDVIPTIAYLLDEASDCLFGQNIVLLH